MTSLPSNPSPRSGPALRRPAHTPGLERSRYLGFLVALLAGLLLAGIAGSWLLYDWVRDEMDRQLEVRLLSIATTAAQGIGSERFREVLARGPGSPEHERLRSEMERAAQANDLDDVVLVDADRRVVLSLQPMSKALAPDPLLDLQPELRTTLVSGESRATRLVEVKGLPGEFLKTGFAAIEDSSGAILGAVAVEGGSDFFSVLPGMRRKILWSAAGAMAAVLVLIILLLRVLRSFLRYEDSLRQAAALAAIGQISAIVAHEIKNPLAIIRSRAERVAAKIEAGKDPREVLEWFAAIPAEVDRLDAILTSYLSLARPEQEGEGICLLAPAARETCRLLEPELVKKGITLETEFEDPEGLSAPLAPRSVRQVLLNLMLNASQAMEAGGRLSVRSRRVPPHVVLEVADTGVGMTEQERRRALDPFFTTRPTGSGLGLTLVQSLVQARGGTVEIRSAPGEGTEVSIRLPAV